MVTIEGEKLGEVGLAVLIGRGSDGLEECRRLPRGSLGSSHLVIH